MSTSLYPTVLFQSAFRSLLLKIPARPLRPLPSSVSSSLPGRAQHSHQLNTFLPAGFLGLISLVLSSLTSFTSGYSIAYLASPLGCLKVVSNLKRIEQSFWFKPSAGALISISVKGFTIHLDAQARNSIGILGFLTSLYIIRRQDSATFPM